LQLARARLRGNGLSPGRRVRQGRRSREPDAKSFEVAAEKLEADKAVIAVAITGRNAAHRKAADQTVRYAFARAPVNGRSTTSKARATASPGRSVRCSPTP